MAAGTRVLIVGPGALGLLFGHAFHRAGARVFFVGRRGREERHIGTLYDPEGRRHRFPLRFLSPEQAQAQAWDAVWVTVKTYSLQTVVPWMARVSSPEVVFPQNGIGFEGDLQQRIAGFVRAVTSEGATRTGRFTVQHRGRGRTFLGGRGLVSTRLLQQAGLAAEERPDLRPIVLAKLLANVAINPLTALLRVPNGTLRQNSHLWTLVQQIVAETVPVLRRHGYPFGPEEALRFVEEIVVRTARNRSSMLQDLEAGRPLELDFLTGWLLRQAPGALPTVQTLHHLLLALTAPALSPPAKED